MKDNKLTVVIAGRTNVGKSTLFNRLVGKSQALVSDIENTTRDSNLGVVEWRGLEFNLVDTAGVTDIKYLLTGKKSARKLAHMNTIEVKTQKLVGTFFKKADLVLLVVDAKAGLLLADKEIASFLKKQGYQKRLLLVANKVDSARVLPTVAEFNKLSLGEPLPVSATTSSGTGDLLDKVVEFLDPELLTEKAKPIKEDRQDKPINVCILGQPNVGKSSLLNAILGYERVIVSEIPHTTREPQNTEIIYKDQAINLIDTAGISKHGHKSQNLEKYGIAKTLNALKKADIALLMLDVSQELTHQDAKLIEEIFERGKSFIILANKWDLISPKDTKKYTGIIYQRLPFATWAPIQFTSALTGSKVQKIFDLILQISAARHLELNSSQLHRFLKDSIKKHRPAKGKGYKFPYIYEITQAGVNPPKFKIRIGSKDTLHFSYVRFIENQLRAKFGFVGTPLHMEVVKARHIHGQSEKSVQERLDLEDDK
jgi:GTP-binding protein